MRAPCVLSLRIVGNDRESEQEILRLRSLIDLLREEALMQSRDFGLLFTETGYRFYIYDYQQLAWVEPADDRLLREHSLRPPLNMSLTLEERRLVLAPSFESLEMEEPEPQVMILVERRADSVRIRCLSGFQRRPLHAHGRARRQARGY